MISFTELKNFLKQKKNPLIKAIFFFQESYNFSFIYHASEILIILSSTDNRESEYD